LGGGGAVIIGISQYQHLDSLQFAHRDAAAFAEFLKTQNVPDENIKLFINQDATRFNIVDELYNLSLKLKKGDTFYFYFTGHGDLEAKIGYENSLLLLYPSLRKNYFQGNEYLQLSELRTWFGELTKKGVEVVFIADACHSGGLIGGKEGLDKTQRALQESWQGITKILSSQANEFSLEGKQWGGGRGIFSYFLTNGLTGRADANKDKKVSLAELSNHLKTNVVREAAPSIQTPVVQGNGKQVLSKVGEEAMKKLAQAERLNFPIMTEVNLRATDPLSMLGGLDNSLVETYKKFTKAIEEKRINTFDNEKDYALLHYRKLAKEKMPEHLLGIIKRNLGAALMERELVLLKAARGQGRGAVVRLENQLNPAIANLDEAIKIFGTDHYFHKFLQARKLVLQARTDYPKFNELSNKNSIDEFTRILETKKLKYYYKERQLLLAGLALEPNMISTYALLSSNYSEAKNVIHSSKFEEKAQMQDSSIYFQEKVIELLPNQAEAHFQLALTYPQTVHIEGKGIQNVAHPKAISHLERAVVLDSNLTPALSRLADMCQLAEVKKYPTAIRCYERLLRMDEATERQLLAQGNEKYLQAIQADKIPNQARNIATSICRQYISLYLAHKLNGEPSKAQYYWQKLNEKSELINMAGLYGSHATILVFKFGDVEMVDNLKDALYFAEKSLKAAEKELNAATEANKPLETLKYQDRLKIIGSMHRNLGNYDQAEMYLKQAIVYPVLPGPFTGKIKYMGSFSSISDSLKGREVTIPIPLRPMRDNQYQYGVEANYEMFRLKLEQNKTDEAFEWLEKAFQFAQTENGNDASGEPMEKYFIESYPALKDRFKALKAKYFPPTEKK
jgi:hypothetical protein